MPDRNAREFDVVVYGASGFTGRLAAAYLHESYGDTIRWALAGRDVSRLTAIRAAAGLPHRIPIIQADANDAVSVRDMTGRAKVLISTVGPYQLNGSAAVAACASSGTDYVDMAGEPVWMRDMIDAHAEAATASGARLMFSCGFDSIPFDLSVHRLQNRCISRWGRPAARIRCRVLGLSGGVSGGTAATRRATEAAIKERPELPALLADPFLLTPGWRGAEQPAMDAVTFEAETGHWVAPFYMAFINTKHVHRTNWLTGARYGQHFAYDEMIVVAGDGDAGRREAEKRAAFDPFDGTDDLRSGEGPSPEERARNFFDLVFIADGPAGEQLAVRCHSALDPGYEGTARMLGETALLLAETAGEGGFWTPASLFGDSLIDRLRTQADIAFDDADPAIVFSRQENRDEF